MTSADHTRERATTDDDEDVLDIVARLRAGERSAVAEVYDRHHGALRAFARRLVGDDGIAEDLVHDVFVALPRAIRRYEGRATLRTFLVAIAIRTSRHHVRAAARARRMRERLASAQSASADARREVSGRELAAALDRALDALPDEQRVAFVLVAIEERTAADASAIVGAPEATVRTRVARAREKLRALLALEEP